MRINWTKRALCGMAAVLAVPVFWTLATPEASHPQILDAPATEQPAIEQTSASLADTGQPAPPPAKAQVASPEGLTALIQAAQSSEVRESCGVWAHEAVTDIDLENFKREGVARKVAERVRTSEAFQGIVVALRAMDPEKREIFLLSCRRPLRQTFAQAGKIQCGLQTDAGQTEERMVADAIVEAAEDSIQAAH